MSAFTFVEHKTSPERRIVTRQYLREKEAEKDAKMNVFKKKHIFIPRRGATFTKEFSTGQGQVMERCVLGDSTNIVIQSRRPSTLLQDCVPIYIDKPKPHCTYKKTPGGYNDSKRTRRPKLSGISKHNLCLSGPERVVPFDEPMEVEDPARRIRELMKTIPIGVDDVDSGENEFYSPHYAQDVIDYLQAVETTWTFPLDYLEDQTSITPKMRSVLVDWLFLVQNNENIHQETLQLTVSLIDRYISISDLSLSELQLLGITCLLIAAKYVERFPPEIETLCHLTDDSYTFDQVITMEITILKKLKFDLNIPGPIFFLDRFLKVEVHCMKVPFLCRYLLDLSLLSSSSVQYVSSLLAAGAVCLSRKLLGTHSDKLWTRNLVFYTKYSEQDLALCLQHFHFLLNKMAVKSQFHSAFKLYQKPENGSISTHPAVYQK